MTFTKKDVLQAMSEVVAEVGEDRVYQIPKGAYNCVYTDNGEPSCLIGHVINKLDPEAFRELRRADAAYTGIAALALQEGGYLPQKFWTKSAMAVASSAQRAQDQGNTWGEALGQAKSSW